MMKIIPVFLWLFLLLPGARIFAAEAGSEPAVTREAAKEMAPVRIDNMFLFSVRGISSYPAGERAESLKERIEAVASDPRIPTSAITVVESRYSTDLTVNGRIVMSVFDLDAVPEGVTRQLLANAYLRQIKIAIEKYRSDRRPENIIKGIIFALGVTIIFVIALITSGKLYARFGALMERRFRARIQALRIKSFEIVQAGTVWTTLINGLRSIRVVLVLVLSYIYVYTVLEFFPWTRLLADNLLFYIVTPLKRVGIAVLQYVPNLIFVLVIVVVTRYVLKLVGLFFIGIERGSVQLRSFDSSWARPTYKMVRLLIIVFVAIIIYPYIPGSESGAFKGVSIFLGVVFSLSSSSAIANIIAGYMLTYRRAFRVGDRVKIGEIEGDVSEIRLQVTHVKTIKNEEITVPNSLILGSSVMNYNAMAKEKGLILHTTVTIGYDVPWRQVDAMLLMAAGQTPGVLSEPQPFIHHKSLDDYYITYELNVYTDNPQGMAETYSELHHHILDAFNEYGVQMMVPGYENDPEGGAKIVPRDKWFSPPAKPPE